MNRNHALLALRLVVAAIFLWHGYPKAIDPAGAVDKFIGMGVFGFLGPVVGWAEVIAGLSLALGFMHRLASGVLLVIILGALIMVQIPNGISSGLERDMLVLASLLVLIMESRLGFSVTGRSQAE
jgi:putative oxidoreductase